MTENSSRTTFQGAFQLTTPCIRSSLPFVNLLWPVTGVIISQLTLKICEKPASAQFLGSWHTENWTFAVA